MMASSGDSRDVDVALAVERRHWHGCSAYCGIFRVFVVFHVVAEISFPGNDAARVIFHLHGEVSAWVDGIGHAVRVGDLVHLDLVQHYFDADTRPALRIFHKDEGSSLATREVAEEFLIAGVLFVINLGR